MKFVIDNKIPFIKGRLEPFGEVVYESPEKITPELVKDADVLVVRTRIKVNETLLSGSKVRLVVTATIGTDHIDLDWCAANGVEVHNAAGCNAPAVAQYVWTALCELGFDPSRHTLGVVGHGNVGQIVAEWGEKLGARVIVCDPPQARVNAAGQYRSLDEVLRQSDAVTLHVPLTKEGEYPTYHMISTPQLQLMKPDAILINSSRGPVVDNKAWSRSLARGEGRAVVDVWEDEPDILPALFERASIATPHIAGYSLEGKQRATRMALEAIGRALGISPDLSGLEGAYIAPEKINSLDEIASSYDIMADDAALRETPWDFEKLRSDYLFRPEPRFTPHNSDL